MILSLEHSLMFCGPLTCPSLLDQTLRTMMKVGQWVHPCCYIGCFRWIMYCDSDLIFFADYSLCSIIYWYFIIPLIVILRLFALLVPDCSGQCVYYFFTGTFYTWMQIQRVSVWKLLCDILLNDLQTTTFGEKLVFGSQQRRWNYERQSCKEKQTCSSLPAKTIER